MHKVKTLSLIHIYGKATVKTKLRTEFLFENILNYNKEFNKIHRLGITLMQSVNAMKTTETEQTAMGFSSDEKGYNALSSAVNFNTPIRGISERKLLSYLGLSLIHIFPSSAFMPCGSLALK